MQDLAHLFRATAFVIVVPEDTEDGDCRRFDVFGEDLSLAMDVVAITRPFLGMPEYAIVNLVLAPYLALGIVPVVIPPIVPIVQSPTDGWDTQTNQTDRDYIRQIAQRCGIPLKIAAKVDNADRDYFEAQIRPLLDSPLIEYLGEIDDQ